jgi:hypothetical protein
MVDTMIKQLQAFLATLGIIATLASPTPTPISNPADITIIPSPTTVVQEMQISPTQPTQQFAPQAVSAPAPSGSSRNWSGYAATQGTFTSVTGSWTIPSVAATGHAGADVAWVGIGGISSRDLIQCGTQNLISDFGQVTTSAFYEILPDASSVIPININVGDSITVTITEVSQNQWNISFIDNTQGKTFNTTVSYTSSHSSAEWIEEAPSDGNLQLPLDNFDSIQFLNATAVQNGNRVNIAQSNAQPINMVNITNQIIASPSSLGDDGSSFTVTRSSAQSSTPVPAFDRNVRSFRRRGFGIGHFTPLTQQQSRQRFWIRPTIVPNITQESSHSGNFWDRLPPLFFHRGNRMKRLTQ